MMPERGAIKSELDIRATISLAPTLLSESPTVHIKMAVVCILS